MSPASDARALREAAKKEAAELIKAAFPPSTPGETTKVRIGRAARNLGWPDGRTQDIWNGEARRIEAHEMDQLRKLARGI